MSEKPPVPSGAAWATWATRLYRYLIRTRSVLADLVGSESAAEDGVLLWDRANKYPVVSKDGEFIQVVLEGGNANLYRSTDATAGVIDTAYAIQYDAPVGANDISLDAIDATKIVFAKSGEYLLSFTAQIASGTSSAINFYFWPRKNGTDVAGSTIQNSIKQNNTILLVSRSAIFSITAGDYIQAMWATDDVNGLLDATAATAFAPASPSSSITITRIHG